jgi:hypothetical protein
MKQLISFAAALFWLLRPCRGNTADRDPGHRPEPARKNHCTVTAPGRGRSGPSVKSLTGSLATQISVTGKQRFSTDGRQLEPGRSRPACAWAWAYPLAGTRSLPVTIMITVTTSNSSSIMIMPVNTAAIYWHRPCTVMCMDALLTSRLQHCRTVTEPGRHDPPASHDVGRRPA